MLANAFKRPEDASAGQKSPFSLRIAFSYSVFLLLCLALGACLYISSMRNARTSFWDQRAAQLESRMETMSGYLSIMDNYTRQLLTDSTFIRFSNMTGLFESGFVYTAYEVMQSLSPRQYSLINIPVRETHIYLEQSDYVISNSQFTEARSYYHDYCHYNADEYDAWMALLAQAGPDGACRDVSSFTGLPGDSFYFRDIDALMNRSIPAVIWFELDIPALERLFFPEGAADGSFVVITDREGNLELVLPSATSSETIAQLENAAYDESGFSSKGDMRLIRRRSADDGWSYVIALPHALCDEALGNYDWLFILLILLALLGGGALVAMLVRYNVKPIQQLNTQLVKAEDDKAQLQQEMDSQRPALQASYVRKLLSGHVSSNEEFDYMLDFLGLANCACFYVLFCVAHRQDSAPSDPTAEYEAIGTHLAEYLTGDYPPYFYTTLDRSFVVLMGFSSDVAEPLMDLQKRVVDLHEHLSMEHSLWLYAGIGSCCTQSNQLWESYEQSRMAAHYTDKHHIFLPYELMNKDTSSFYYPVEISAKLQHFITSGNAQQTVEMFALIRRENLEERTLPITLLNFLLSDLKNTLLKARFQIVARTDDERARMSVIDERLYAQASFPLLESTALMLCEFFTPTSEPSDPIPDIVRYLTENFTDPSMCLSKLSDRFNISESYLSHLFKNRTGQNFSVYLENLRLNEAAKRLTQQKGCNLTSLYMELGYNNPTSFRRAFKKRFGITPSEMRQHV